MIDCLVYAEHNWVMATVQSWDSIFGDGEGAMQFSRGVTIHAPHAEIGRKDRTVLIKVVCCGPGNVSRGVLNECHLNRDDLVVANLMHRGYEPRILNESMSLFPWETLMARIEIEHELKALNLQPLQAYLVCKPNEKEAQKLIMGESKIIAPFGDAQYAGELPEQMPGRAKPEPNKTVIEEVVDVGPGAVVDGLYQQPPRELIGGMVMYDTSVSPIRFLVQGQAYTLVHWRHVLLSFRRPETLGAKTTEASGQTIH